MSNTREPERDPLQRESPANEASRAKLREDLEISEASYRGLVEGSIQGILIQADGIVRLANPALARLLGYDQPSGFIGKSMWPFVAPADRERIEGYMTARMRGEPAPTRFELRVIKRGGAIAWIDCIVTTIDWDGEPAVLITMVDVTERRVLEEQFRQAQKMEAVGRLASGVAHDFNNLITVIAAFSDLLIESLDPADPRREELNYIQRAAQTGAALTRQLLAFSRQQVLAPRVLSLNEVVRDTEKLLKPLVGDDVELVTTLEPDAGWVRADAGEIQQVILNLAVNARDAMPGGGTLTMGTTNEELDDAFAREHFAALPGPYVMLMVSDSGVGMDERTRARIFEPFFTTKAPGKGTGLGLATVYGIVQRNGGFIWPSSELGRGATFRIYLPRVENPAAEDQATATHELQPGTETVLLVEDAAAVRAAMCQVLRRIGYTVIEAPDGEAALSIASKHSGRIDLLLTDMVMPRMSGIRLSEQLLGVRPALKVLLMSGYSEDIATRHGIIRHEVAYLQKPFTMEGLARKVRAVLDAG